MSEMKARIKKINNKLINKFGIPKRNKKLPNPLDMLIATILSQNTNDGNSYKAFRNLKDNFKSWNEVANLSAKQIEKYINVAGLGNQKSKAIKNLLTYIEKQNIKLNQKYFSGRDDDDILSELISMKGIGVKTASCVLLFSLDRNVCPVDTHVHRTTNRLGLVNTKSPDKTFEALKFNIPDGIAHQFHTNLIRLGREICKPAKPRCAVCPLLELCEYDDKNIEESFAGEERKFMLLDNIR